ERARAPDTDAPAGESPDAVDAHRVEQRLLVGGRLELQVDTAADRLVGRRLVHAALAVDPRPDAGDVARGRHADRLASDGIVDADPRVVERGVRRVVARLVHTPVLDGLWLHAGRSVEDGHAVAVALAVVDHGRLHRADAVLVDPAALVGAHQVGRADDGQFVDGIEASQSGAVGGIADVLRRRHAVHGDGGLRRFQAEE